jgi:Na+/proline symporter
MNILDWLVLGGTLLFIVGYGSWKNRENKDIQSYLLGNKQANWFTVALSIMATQASAITFLSAPGQAYTDGMRFVQFYFGLPLAMIVLSIAVVPIYHRLNVYTAYEFLEKRFDVKTRVLAAFLFLTQRGLAAGFTIFAPSLILSSLLGWNIDLTNILIGTLVVVYTVTGGTKAVSLTQKYQMAVILVGMVVAGVMVVALLPEKVSFGNALHMAGKMGKLNAVDLDFDLTSRYNIWSGLIGGFFLALSYFGTDQSQVQRYLSGSSIGQSRLGLLFNGMVKIPMQFLILLIGALLYVFYFFNQPPVFFNKVVYEKTMNSAYADELKSLQDEHSILFYQRKEAATALADALGQGDETSVNSTMEGLMELNQQVAAVRERSVAVIKQADPKADTNDTNYIFLTFVTDYLPAGLVGLLIAVILSASMSSTSSELNALASTTVVDIYKRFVKPEASDRHYVVMSKWITALWGVYAIIFTMFANQLGTLIEAVNILGSLVYGSILGIFLVAFFLKKIHGKPTFIAAIIAQSFILYLFFFTKTPYLWFNVIGCLLVIAFAWVLNPFFRKPTTTES